MCSKHKEGNKEMKNRYRGLFLNELLAEKESIESSIGKLDSNIALNKEKKQERLRNKIEQIDNEILNYKGA